MDPLLSKLEALPVELQLAILQHIPPRQDSTLPFASLLSISRSSRTLHTLVSPLLYAEVRLSSTQQVQRLLDDSAPHLEQYVRRLTLRRSNLNSTVWDLQTLSKLLGALSELTELSLDGVVDQRTLRRLLHDLPTKDRFERLDLTCAQPATNRADYPHSAVAAAAVPGDDDPFLSLSHASEPSWVEALAGFPALVHLRLVNADLVVAPSPSASASLFPDGSAGSSISVSLLSSLRSVELEGVSLTDAVLRTFLTGGKVEEVALRRCTGFSRTGFVEAIKSNGGRIRRLELVDNGGVATTPSLLPSPLSSPSRSPTLLSASTRTLPSLSATSPTLVGILDSVLPFLPHLTHLSTSGALFSPTLLHQLHTLTAHLLHLSISAQPHITPAALLPLLHQSPPDEKSAYLPSLRRLELHGSTSPSPSYSCTLSPWSTTSLSTGASNDCSILDLCTTARAQDVHLVGEVFEQVQERLDWAEREAQKLASGMERLNVQEEEGGKGVRRRKRPGEAVRG